jgi:tripartite-type tricarboxylate transporter receptor subunit TctC
MWMAAWVAPWAASWAAAAPPAQAAPEYPVKPIRVIVPNSAGGATDIAARIVATPLAAVLGQPLIVDNRVGAGGVLGTNAASEAAPDGYTLLVVFDSLTTNPFLFAGVRYEPAKDFAPIGLIARSPQALVVNPQVPAKTVAEFVALARERGVNLPFATAGAGTSSRLSLELFKKTAGIDPTEVHYKGGSPAINDLLGGTVSAMIVNLGVVSQQIEHGRLVALGVTSPHRSSLFPKIPAIAETYPGFEAEGWVGLLAPAGTPAPVIERLHGALGEVLGQPEVRSRFAAQGAEVASGTPGQFSELIRAETIKWGDIIRSQHITVQ